MIDQEQLENLSVKIDGLIELELGKRLPFIGLTLNPESHQLLLYTNRRDNREVQMMLKEALEQLKKNPTFTRTWE